MRKPFRAGSLGQKGLGKYCVFHEAKGREIGDCLHLKDQIEFIRNEYLTEFVVLEAKKYNVEKGGKDKAPGN